MWHLNGVTDRIGEEEPLEKRRLRNEIRDTKGIAQMLRDDTGADSNVDATYGHEDVCGAS